MKVLAKKAIATFLVTTGVDAVFRHLNRDKLLVIMYHAVTEKKYRPPVWTHLPVEKFGEQLNFLASHYTIVSLEQVLDALEGKGTLPTRAALITFDDGYMNNKTVVFPLLAKLNVPATVFLTVDKIGSRIPLWFDELYLHLSAPCNSDRRLPFVTDGASAHFAAGRIWEAYWDTAEPLKLCGSSTRERYLEDLRASSLLQSEQLDDFSFLGWEEIKEMYNSGLVSFGVHTATHQIVSRIPRDEWEREILAPRKKLEDVLRGPVKSFCFPNGRPGIDFQEEHLPYLERSGYSCSFTTEGELFAPGADDPMQIGRIAAGNDISSDRNFFRLNSAGCLAALRRCFARQRTG